MIGAGEIWMMTGLGRLGASEGIGDNAAAAMDVGWSAGARMKWSVGRSDGRGAGRNTGPASAVQANARAQSTRLRLMPLL